MKVAVFLVKIRVEDFDEGALRQQSELMNVQGVLSVTPLPQLNEIRGDRKRERGERT